MFQGQFARLSCDKFGSHVVDAVWEYSSTEYRATIAEELLSQEHELRGNCFGRHVLVNCSIDEYKHNRHSWDSKQKASRKRKSEFSNFLAEETTNAPAAKRKKKHSTAAEGQDSSLNSYLSVLGFPSGAAAEVGVEPSQYSEKYFCALGCLGMRAVCICVTIQHTHCDSVQIETFQMLYAAHSHKLTRFT